MVSHRVTPTVNPLYFANGYRINNPAAGGGSIFVNAIGRFNGSYNGISIGFSQPDGSDIIVGRFSLDEAEEVALAILIRIKEERDATGT